MGMFDYVVIDLDLLPITKKEKKDLGGQGFQNFQTKDMDNLLDTIHITKDSVWVERHTWHKSPVEHHLTEILEDYSGCIQFYGDGINVGTWYEFLAKIRHGKLKEVVRVYETV